MNRAPESIDELNDRATYYQTGLSILSQSELLRPTYVLGLAFTLLQRHELSKQEDDLDKSIFHFTEFIHLPPDSDEKLTIRALFHLAVAHVKRSEVSKRPEDAIYATKYLRQIRNQPHQALVVYPDHQVTSLLVYALAIQVESGAGNLMQIIGELAALCRELLTWDMSAAGTTNSIAYLAHVASSKIHPWALDQPLDQVIECLRAARNLTHKPGLHFPLAYSLSCRYHITLANDDYEEAVSIYDEIVASGFPGDADQDELVAMAHACLTMLAGVRSNSHHNPEYSEEAMYCARTFLSSSAAKYPLHPSPDVDNLLEDIAGRRFLYFGPIEGLETRSSNSPLTVLDKYDNDESEHGRMHQRVKHLGRLLTVIRRDSITKIDEAIEKGRTILASSAPIYPLMLYVSLLFGVMLSEAFKRTKRIEFLNESIDTHRQVLESPFSQDQHLLSLGLLAKALVIRSGFSPEYRAQDDEEAMKILSQCVNDPQASLPDQFLYACMRADCARTIHYPSSHPSISAAYKSAMSLMRNILDFAPTLQLQHATLTTTDIFHKMPLDYASYQIELDQLDDAIETLETGRALLWSEMRHLRTSVDQLLEADPDLGHNFAAINRDLEDLAKSIPPSHRLGTSSVTANDSDLRAVDPFGRFLLKQRVLLKERNNLISQIQALPGIGNFLTSHSFKTLRSAASSGPVIIINHSRWRSHILILLYNTSPSLIPTPRDFYDHAHALKDRLLESRRKYGLDSSCYDQTLAFVLAELYELVGKPVIDRLHQLGVPEQSRIWWCPTSVFCSLPLHAMGPIPSDDGEKRYFLDLYICSYTPTLSALIQSRNRHLGSRSSEKPSILLVAQPDPTLPTVKGEIQVVQDLQDNTNTKVTSLISETATPAAVIDGFRNHQIVHFACHGTLKVGKPFEAGFELYGDERLTLLEIVRSHLPTAEFAFLSACHTAEVTEGSIDDEILHLAAAVQYCGFRSVVGTMWAMVDEDGRDLAEHFYTTLFSNSRRVPYYERSAKALRVAVKKLRKKRRITLERWVNFVHYGA